MKVERLLQINVAALAALGTTLLGMEQQSMVMPLAVLAAAVISVYFTDHLGWINLPRYMTNIVALLAVLLTLARISQLGDGSDLIALANLLVYLQIVLLFQKKNSRSYWQLIALSLLQVVVAAALNMGMMFGMLVAIYLFVALGALCLFFVYRETRPFAYAISSANGTMATLPTTARHRLVPYVRTDLSAAILTGSLLRRVLGIGLSTLLITVIFFFAVPRFRDANQQAERRAGQKLTGVSAEVDLDDMGDILESPETVMRVSYYDDLTGKPYRVMGEPYIFGTALSVYNLEGRWSAHSVGHLQELESPPPSNRTPLVRVDVVLEAGRHPFLFSIPPIYHGANSVQGLLYDVANFRLQIGEEPAHESSKKLRYTFTTTAFQRGIQKSQLVPPVYDGQSVRQQEAMIQLCSKFNSVALNEIETLANQIIDEASVDRSDRLSVSRVLEAHFLRSGRYTYSLGGSPQRDRSRDPIVDFVTNHRTGHCEFFASALALMLRSQGIPSRLILGYKGSDYNEVGKYHVIRQLHAHAWVEAHLPLQNASDAATETQAEMGWLRLDPTPAADYVVREFPGSTMLQRIGQWMDYSQVVWNEYVLGLNFERQRADVYEPVLDQIRQFFRTLFDREAWSYMWQQASGQLAIDWEYWRHHWFSWQAGLASITVCLTLLSLSWLGRILGRYVHSLWAQRKWRRWYQHHPRAAIFRRYQRLIAQRGWKQNHKQTTREFAHLIQTQLSRQPHLAEHAGIPDRIANAYDRVRFGKQTLDSREIQDLDLAITQLERTWSNRRA